MRKSPLTVVKERFSDKAGLIKAVRDLASDALWIDRINADKGIDRLANRQLLHIHDVLSEVKKAFGSRDKLIDAVLEQQKRVKDGDYRESLKRLSTPRLWDMFGAGKKRAKNAA
jgi:hypothetical protein